MDIDDIAEVHVFKWRDEKEERLTCAPEFFLHYNALSLLLVASQCIGYCRE